MKIIRSPLYDEFEEEGGSGGGAGTLESVHSPETTAPNGDEPGSSEGGQQTQQPASPQFTLEQVTQLMQSVPQPQTPQQPQMTQEQLLEQIGMPQVPELQALAHALDLDDERAKALHEIFNGYSSNINQHTLKLLGLLQAGVQRQMQDSLAPLTAMQQKQEVESFVSHVAKSSPGLKGYEKVIQNVLQQMISSGYQYTTDAQAIQDVTLHATELIRAVNPQFNPAQAAAPQTNGNLPQMNGGYMGTTSGANSSSSDPNNQPLWKKAFKR